MTKKGQWTQEDFVNFMRGMNDEAKKRGVSPLEYRLSTLYWIIDERTNQVVKFRPNFVQRKVLRMLWWLTFILKARQHGVSTLMSLILLDHCLFNANYRAAIVDRKDDEAKKKLAKMKFAYDNLDRGDGDKPFEFGAMLKMACPLVAPTNDHMMSFANGSNCIAATGHRGGTINWLWISEFGYIASEDPSRAQEIASGSFNTVHPGNFITIETTHEGGRYGLSYEIVRASEVNKFKPNREMRQMDWRLIFCGWWENPDYAINVPRGETLQIPAVLNRYFMALESDIGQNLSEAQKNWYCQKWATPGVDMARQYPGTIEEALSASTEGAIYGDQMSLLRAKGRITNLSMNGHAPLVTAWDIGQSDYTCIWLVQLFGQDILCLDYYSSHNKTPAEYASQMILWERQYKPIAIHFLPHDSTNRQHDGRTYMDLLQEAGIHNIKRVVRIPDIWVGINAVRAILPRCYFDLQQCEKKDFKTEGDRIVLPSGVACLEGYRKKLESSSGNIKEMPVHDEASHGASAFRTLAEADMRKMLNSFTSFAGPTRNRVTVIRDRQNLPRKATVVR